jgi:hypothetical protein
LPANCVTRLTDTCPVPLLHKGEYNMVPEINLDDVVRLKKVHPCGGYEWRVVRLGADIGIKCITCGRRVLLERSVFERRVKELVSRGKE